jgi:hypothetical protein
LTAPCFSFAKQNYNFPLIESKMPQFYSICAIISPPACTTLRPISEQSNSLSLQTTRSKFVRVEYPEFVVQAFFPCLYLLDQPFYFVRGLCHRAGSQPSRGAHPKIGTQPCFHTHHPHTLATRLPTFERPHHAQPQSDLSHLSISPLITHHHHQKSFLFLYYIHYGKLHGRILK